MAQETVQLDIELSSGEKAGETLGQLTAQSRKLTKEIKNLKPGTEEFVKKSQDLQKVNGRVKGIKTEMYGTNQATKGVVSSFGQMLPFTGRFGQLGASIAAMRPALNSSAGASQLLAAAMRAIPIFAIIGAITALISWFKRTEQGAQALRVITAGLSQVFESLMDIVSGLGKTIFDAVNNPKEAIQGLGNSIKEYLLERVQLLISGFKGLGTAISLLFKGEFAEASKEAGNSLLEITRATNPLAMAIEGIVDNSDKISDAFKEIQNDVKGAVALQRRENRLLEDKRKFKVEEARLEAQISELRRIGNDQTLTATEREQALSKAMEVQKTLVGARTRLAQEEFQIQKQRNALSDSTEADLMREAELHAAVIQVQKRGDDEMRTIISRQSGLRKKLAEERIKEQEDLQKMEIEAEKALQDLRVELIDDASTREISKINLEYERKLEAITGNEEQITEQRLLLEQQRQDQIAELRNNREKELEQESFELRMERLQNQFLTTAMTEQEFQQAEFEAKQAHAQQSVDLARQQYGAESLEYMQASNELLELQRAYSAEHLETVKTTEEAKRQMQMSTLGATSDLFSVMASLMSEDEKARKENAKAIKAFSVAQILANLYQEISGYFSNPGSTLTFGALGAIKAIAATGRAFAAIANVNKQKFSLGGILSTAKYMQGGILRGPKHSQGGIPFMNMRDNTVSEFEGDEIILTGGVSRSPWGRTMASNLNAAFGGRKFATGGPINPLTTINQAQNLTAGRQSNQEAMGMQQLIQEVQLLNENQQRMFSEISTWQRTIRVTQNLTDVEEGLTDLSQVRVDSEF